MYSNDKWISIMISGYIGYKTPGFKFRFDKILEGDINHLAFHKYIDTQYVDCEQKSIANNALTWKGFLRCKQTLEGELIKNLDALANPESLKQFKDIKELNE